MKSIVLVLCMAALAALSSAGKEEGMKSFKECLEENDINDDLEKLKSSEDPKLRCIMSCVFEKQGILKDGEIDVNALKEDVYSNAEKLGDREVDKIINSCVNMAKDLSDMCDKTNLIGICIKDELEKHDIKLE